MFLSESLPTTVFVCTTCRRGEEPLEPRSQRSGARLYEALSARTLDRHDIRILPVECLLNCNHGCNVALRAEGKWSYHFGDLDPAEQLDNIIALAALHRDTPDGEVPWGKRPEAIKRKAVSRIPPLPLTISAKD